jgi:hypothetical protein
LTWWRSTAFSRTSSRRDRTASTATSAISLADLRGASCDPAREALKRRQRELIDAHVTGWLAPFTRRLHVRFERGFLHPMSISISPAEFAAHADPLFRLAAPWRDLAVSSIAGGLAALAGSPALARYRGLRFFKCRLAESEIAHLAASPHVMRLERLDLCNAGIDDAVFATLARSPRLRT